MVNRFTISIEAADNITLQNLEDHYRMTKDSLDKWYGGKGWMHREDVDRCVILTDHLKAVIDYFGGSVGET